MPRRALLLSVLVLVLAGCAYGRSAAALRSTAIGRVPAPQGSALAWETYTPSAFGIDGVQCAHLERVYASNDAQAFIAAIAKAAADHHPKYFRVPSRPVFNDDSVGRSPGLSASEVDGTYFTVDFHDIDDSSYHAPAWIDARAWRYVIVLRLWDEYQWQGGGCH